MGETPLVTVLRHIEWDYGRAGWHGDESVDPALYALHYRTAKRHSIEARRLPIRHDTWGPGPLVVLAGIRLVVERQVTASFITGDDPLWCGLGFAMEVWAAHSDDPGWLSVRPSENPLRHTGRVALAVLAEDLAAVAVYRDQIDGDLQTDAPMAMTGGTAHALTTTVATVDYQRELDAQARRTGVPVDTGP